jgi:streptogrisin C
VLLTSCVPDANSNKIGEVMPQELAPAIAPEMSSALQRDLRLAEVEVPRRLAAERTAARIAPALRDQLGSAFAGAWMDPSGSRLVVGITDAALADGVRSAGAEPQVVARSLAYLDGVKTKLDGDASRAGADIHAWHVDVATNTVVVHAADPDAPATRAFVDGLGVSGGAVRIVPSSERPRPLYDVRGGDEYIINGNTLCSVGFSVNGGFVTAGHCGRAGSPTAGSNWVAQGTFAGSTFPGNDYAWVQTNASWNSLPWVNNYGGGTLRVVGSHEASVGSSICRSGRTTGLRCGVIQARDVTVNYSNGPVYGLTQTSACAEGGDSGGSFISGVEAQGTTSGGSGNCTSGGTTFYQPVNPTLNAYGLRLKTDGAIASRFNNKCIDVPGSNFVDGARLQMWGCNGTGAQRWIFTDGTLQAGGMCMDVAGANSADGTPIQLVHCNGNRAQQFVLNDAGDLVSQLANKCVDIGGWDSSDGARLIIWPCHGGSNQKWYRY